MIFQLASLCMVTFQLANFQFDLNAIAQASALRIVDCLLEGTLIADLCRRRRQDATFAEFERQVRNMVLYLDGDCGLARVVAGRLVARKRERCDADSEPAGDHSARFLGSLCVRSVGSDRRHGFLLGVGRGLWHLHVLRKSCVPVDPAMP
jgi:hypothetical protein